MRTHEVPFLDLIVAIKSRGVRAIDLVLKNIDISWVGSEHDLMSPWIEEGYERLDIKHHEFEPKENKGESYRDLMIHEIPTRFGS